LVWQREIEEAEMFGKKKTKQEIPVISTALGEMKYYRDSWTLCAKQKAAFWDTIYELDCDVETETAEEGINEKQEAAIEKFKEVIVDKKSAIERIIIENSVSDYGIVDEGEIRKRFVPDYILFSKNGECALFVKDVDNDDEGLGIFLVPKLLMYSSGECLAYMIGHGSSYTTEELYGDEGNG
jgi:hypothetical protein